MASLKQIEANRRNAHKSTGPITPEGKNRSRCNAVRHGLTSETVIGALEDAEDYKAFEGAVIADYDAQSAVERELVLRLASLLWRLRRATTIETGLFGIQATTYVRSGRPAKLTRRLETLSVRCLGDPKLRALNMSGQPAKPRARRTSWPIQGRHASIQPPSLGGVFCVWLTFLTMCWTV